MLGRLFGTSAEARASDLSTADLIAAAQRERSGSSRPIVTSENAMRHDAVWASVRSISNPIMAAPVSVHRGDELADRATPSTRVSDVPRIISDPCADWDIDREGFITFAIDSLLLWGNVFCEITANNRHGWPDQMRPIHPSRVTWRQLQSGRVQWQVDNQIMERWPRGPLWHRALYPGANPLGVPAIYHGAHQIGLGLAAQAAASDWFAGGMHPSGIVSTEKPLATDADKAAAVEAKARVNQAVRNREIIAVGGGFKFDPIQVPADQAQFLETINANTPTIARFFGVRPERIGGSAQGGASLTYANLEMSEDQHITQAVNPVAAVLRRGLSALLPHRQYVTLQLDDPRVLGAKVDADVTAIKLRSGQLTHGEARARDNRDPIPGIDPDAYVWPPMVNQSVSLSAVDESGQLLDGTNTDPAVVDFVPAPPAHQNGNGHHAH